jgi:hypothetical protein
MYNVIMDAGCLIKLNLVGSILITIIYEHGQNIYRTGTDIYMYR